MGRRLAAIIALPFVAFIGLFLIYPTIVLVAKSLTPGGDFGTSALTRALQGTYLTGFINSARLSLTSALIGGVLGFILALVLARMDRPRWVRSFIDSWSAVASQLGGVPLAFAFIAAIGTQGLVTKALNLVGIDSSAAGVAPTGFWGLVVVYLYFQIPLMFLVVVPAVMGLRSSWREAAATLGARATRYWLWIGLPILAPSILGGLILLFVNSFTAYATVYVLNPGASLVPLQIRFVLQGNVISGEEDLGYAIVTWVILLLIIALFAMTWLQRRTLQWMAA